MFANSTSYSSSNAAAKTLEFIKFVATYVLWFFILSLIGQLVGTVATFLFGSFGYPVYLAVVLWMLWQGYYNKLFKLCDNVVSVVFNAIGTLFNRFA